MADMKHLATVQVTAEPNGYAVWHNGEFDSLNPTIEVAMQRAQELVRQYKPEFDIY